MTLSRHIKTIQVATLLSGLRLYVIISDPMAGKRGRFTVHRVSLTGMKTTDVIGRELTEAHAKRIVIEDVKANVISEKPLRKNRASKAGKQNV